MGGNGAALPGTGAGFPTMEYQYSTLVQMTYIVKITVTGLNGTTTASDMVSVTVTPI